MHHLWQAGLRRFSPRAWLRAQKLKTVSAEVRERRELVYGTALKEPAIPDSDRPPGLHDSGVYDNDLGEAFVEEVYLTEQPFGVRVCRGERVTDEYDSAAECELLSRQHPQSVHC